MRKTPLLLPMAILACILALLPMSSSASAALVGAEVGPPAKVLVVMLSDQGQFMVDAVQADHVIKAVDKAEAEGYTHLVVSVSTYGGIVMNARDIAERLLRCKIPTTAFVEDKAISAGAYISWACDHIMMRPGSSFGDAQMIMQTLEGIETAPEKMVSLYRSDWRKYSEAKGRSFSMAQAFFDVNAELLWVEGKGGRSFVLREDLPTEDPPSIVEVVNKKGQLLTLHADRAVTLGLAGVHDNLDAYLATLGPAQVDRLEMTLNETVMRFLGANEWIFSLLVLIGLHALYTEMKAPGFGVAGMTALMCFTVVFGSRFVLGSASTFELFLFALGILLCVAEIFLIPGFGVTGVAGLGCMFVALLLSCLPDISPFHLPETGPLGGMFRSLATKLAVVFGLSVVSFLVLLPATLKVALARGGAATPEMLPSSGYVVDTLQGRQALLGVVALAEGDIRPTGRVRHPDGRLLDAKTRGQFIPSGTRVSIVGLEGNEVLVEEAPRA